MSNPRAAALRGARRGVPYVHKSGRHVTVVYEVRVGDDGRLSGTIESVECDSSGKANKLAAMAFALLQEDPRTRNVIGWATLGLEGQDDGAL